MWHFLCHFDLLSMIEEISSHKKGFLIYIHRLGKAFDRVPKDAICWALIKLGRERWLVNIVK